MSKLLWKFLLSSPALLGATLLFSAGEVSAVERADLMASENITSQSGNQLQTADTITKEVKPSLIVAAPTSPVSQKVPTFSPTTKKNLELPELVAGNTKQPTAATPQPEALNLSPVMSEAETTLAQVPNSPVNSGVLEQVNRYSREGRKKKSQNQVTNVSQLRDVSPGDWAFEALRSLVERYGCIAGYPDGTYRGNRPTTRYEFAAGLNACLNQIERLIIESGDSFDRTDLETLQRLVQEFEAELATLGTRVDNLEGRVAFLEDNQFSTTTKLAGEVIFALTDEFNTEPDDASFLDNNNTVFQNRVRMEFNSSFSGKDRLVTRLAAGNADLFQIQGDPQAPNESALGTQTFNLGNTGDNDVIIDWLAYYTTFGASQIYFAGTGGIHSDYVPTLNPFFEDFDGGNGALSTFASENPIYRIGGGVGGAISLGVGVLESVLGPSTITVGYLAGPDSSDPTDGNGLFDGEYSLLGQLNVNIGDKIALGATYVNAYHRGFNSIFDAGGGFSGVVGTRFANDPREIALVPRDNPMVTNSYGVEAAFRLSETISISGFGTLTDVIMIGAGGGEIWTYGGGVALSDLGKEGNVLGIFGGVQPTLRGLDGNIRPAGGFARDNAYHIEGFYKYQLTDNISVTPGVIWLTSPGQDEGQEDAIIGTLRTTFKF
ncbi:MAG: iron uptake porin [Symploca sp. SIO1C4]|uniref:Iron uptake porin n=1 Tax=Symploca sp. SIO1C4 TaxID=2607765 RepID=A0A6B3NQ99_9CYAN|nr:iron uptake porin [Symploca sp. SIO1C4]